MRSGQTCCLNRADVSQLTYLRFSEIVGDFGSKPLYRTLGYFSLIGLLRVHVLLGDYTLALKVMDNIELSPKAFFTRVTACHVATYYYVGFCYLVLRRYPDANRTFVNVLNFVSRMRPYHTRSYQYDQVRLSPLTVLFNV